jgi:hypothetical protein
LRLWSGATAPPTLKGMNQVTTDAFEDAVLGKLREWDLGILELERKLGSPGVNGREAIFGQIEKLNAKRRAAMLKLRELESERVRPESRRGAA